jgi:hypothetical protein
MSPIGAKQTIQPHLCLSASLIGRSGSIAFRLSPIVFPPPCNRYAPLPLGAARAFSARIAAQARPRARVLAAQPVPIAVWAAFGIAAVWQEPIGGVCGPLVAMLAHR